MNSEVILLMLTAASVGFIHTALGPDHYIPFIALSKSNNWNKFKTAVITIFCGAGHVLSSIIIGILGYLLGTTLFSLEVLEKFRGEIAGWLLIAFGLIYFIWGIKQYIKSKPHSHLHSHSDGSTHEHIHTHQNHAHVHLKNKKNLTPWIIFIVFVLGPCEPLIPLLIYPAASNNMFAVITVSLVFGVVTILTMLGLVFLGLYGLSFIPMRKIQNQIHALAGISILFCGIAIQFLGL